MVSERELEHTKQVESELEQLREKQKLFDYECDKHIKEMELKVRSSDMDYNRIERETGQMKAENVKLVEHLSKAKNANATNTVRFKEAVHTYENLLKEHINMAKTAMTEYTSTIK